MTPTVIVALIGVFLTLIAMIVGGVVYIHARNDESKKDAEIKVDEHRREVDIKLANMNMERSRLLLEIEGRAQTANTRLEKLILDERDERRRELDRMEKIVQGFADVASAVVAMGKSIEHVAERQSEHQQQYRSDMSELKTTIRSIEARLMDAGIGFKRDTLK